MRKSVYHSSLLLSESYACHKVNLVWQPRVRAVPLQATQTGMIGFKRQMLQFNLRHS
jgi:hypothetical protein